MGRYNFSLIANSGEGLWSWWPSGSLLFLGLVWLDDTQITAHAFHFSAPPGDFLYGECLKHSTTERQHLLIWGQLLSWCTLQCSSCTKHPGEITKKRPGNFKIGIRQTEMGIINFSELSHFFRRMKQQVSDDRTWTEQLKEAFFSGAHLWHAACAGHSYDLMLTPSTDQYYHFSVEITFQISKGAWGQEKIEINLLHSRLDVF